MIEALVVGTIFFLTGSTIGYVYRRLKQTNIPRMELVRINKATADAEKMFRGEKNPAQLDIMRSL